MIYKRKNIVVVGIFVFIVIFLYDTVHAQDNDKKDSSILIIGDESVQRHDNESFYKGNDYLNKKMYNEAILEFSRAIQINPSLWQAYGNRGNAYREKGDFDKAISDFNTVILNNPKEALAYYNRGLTYNKKGDLDRAISDYTQAIEIDPSLWQAYGNRGNTYYDQDKLEEAISDFTKVIEINPNSDIIYSSRGNAHFKKGDLDQAIFDYEKVIQINPNFDKVYQTNVIDNLVNAYNDKAYTYYSSGNNLEEGLRIIDKAIAFAPNDGIALGTKAELLYKMKRFNEAYEYIKKAVMLEPDNSELKKDLQSIEGALKESK